MERRLSETDINWVRSMIYECMAQGVNKRQAVALLEANWGVSPTMTEIIWDMVQEVRDAFFLWDSINNESWGTHQENAMDVPGPGYRRQQQQQPPYVGGGYHPQNHQTYLATQVWNSNAAGRRRLPMHNTSTPSN